MFVVKKNENRMKRKLRLISYRSRMKVRAFKSFLHRIEFTGFKLSPLIVNSSFDFRVQPKPKVRHVVPACSKHSSLSSVVRVMRLVNDVRAIQELSESSWKRTQ